MVIPSLAAVKTFFSLGNLLKKLLPILILLIAVLFIYKKYHVDVIDNIVEDNELVVNKLKNKILIHESTIEITGKYINGLNKKIKGLNTLVYSLEYNLTIIRNNNSADKLYKQNPYKRRGKNESFDITKYYH